MDRTLSPYEVLGVPCSASAADIRAAFKHLALRTHPDRNIDYFREEEDVSAAHVTHPFYVVKDASELLLDPLRRAEYDQIQQQAYVRSVGAVSDTYNIDDFDLVEERVVDLPESKNTGVVTMLTYQMECRCGGIFELFVTKEVGETREIDNLCKCDCCSLVILVTGEKLSE
ncbi:putative chaperone DNAJ protein [Trypanosoma grayi]|uniref:putative chaperone DNAJ protein n=1 Tax=Trypanosoma grayi TaxID=71804 RepID=UPI0004F44A42|nr:putative chaperone DNAJ protein [Trypanosoma grayi]KEG08072.1 putative chaperone DNAJ protein [Trypanosoma grayi]